MYKTHVSLFRLMTLFIEASISNKNENLTGKHNVNPREITILPLPI